MHSTPQSEVKLKTDVLDALLKVFDLDPRTRAVFREVGGFVYVMSVLINMEGSLANPVSLTWIDGKELILIKCQILLNLNSFPNFRCNELITFKVIISTNGIHDQLPLIPLIDTPYRHPDRYLVSR